MNFSKRFKRENDENENKNEFCDEIDEISRNSCQEFSSVICLHCHRFLCYDHLEAHRLILFTERDELIDELNRNLHAFDQWQNRPETFVKFLIEKSGKNISFSQRLAAENFVDLTKHFDDFVQSNRRILNEQKSVSVVQIAKLRKMRDEFLSFCQISFDEFIASIPIDSTSKTFQMSMFDSATRQICLSSFQKSSSNEFASNNEILIFSDRDRLLIFDLNDFSTPEIIDWKIHLDGKIVDLQFCFYSKLFWILTEEKLFSFRREISSLICRRRFTSTPWALTTLFDAIFLLYKSSLDVDRWVFDDSSRSKQWRCDEILPDFRHDQHFRSIRSNRNQNRLAILIVRLDFSFERFSSTFSFRYV